MLAEFLPVEMEQRLPVPGFFGLHVFEHFRGGGIGVAKPVGEVTVDATILFLEKNRECQNLALTEILEIPFGHRGFPRPIKSRKSCCAHCVVDLPWGGEMSQTCGAVHPLNIEAPRVWT
jgi:hypothetical protein